MDPSRFDHLTRLLGRATGRRGALGALLGALFGPAAVPEIDARKKPGKGRDNDKDKDKDKDRGGDRGSNWDRQANQRLQAERRGPGRKRRKHKTKRGGRGNGGTPPPAACCGTESCASPEPGSTRSQCNFAGQSFAGQDLNGSTFRGIDGRGATFNQTDNQGSIFAEACLQGARFRRARLDGSTWGDACLFDADFAGADLGGDETLFDEARFCGTTMPDGTLNDRDCGRATACCQQRPEPGPACQRAADCADQPCQTKTCQNGQCAYDEVFTGPSPNSLCTVCCDGDCCLAPANQCNTQNGCCAPNCEGRVCGPDGCGGDGTCGACPDGQVCDDIVGVCLCTRQSCPNGCCANGPGNPGACRPGTTNQNCGTGGNACQQCSALDQCEDGVCTPAVCSGNCTQDNDCPDLRNCVCNRAEGTCCSRNCGGKVCGSDGCGGTCENLCPPNTVCSPDGTQCLCTAQSCPNGCCSNGLGNPGTCVAGDANEACGLPGESCQTCTGREQCQNRQCVCIPLTCDDLTSECGTFSDGCGGTLECGTCPDLENPSCFVGVCVPCTFACKNGEDCYNLTNGDTICQTGADIDCGEPCASNASCTDAQFPICVASITNGARSTPPNQTTTIATFCEGVPAACGALNE